MKRLKELRENKHLTQAQLSKFLNISASTIGMYEQGRRFPDEILLKNIAQFFNVSLDYLLGLSDISCTVENFIVQQEKSNKTVNTECTPDEQELLKLYRELPYEGQVTVKTIAKTHHDLYVKPKCNEKAI